MKRFLVIATLLFLSNTLRSQSVKWTEFKWIGFSTKDTTFEKAAIFIPIYLDGIETTYYMQLDLGSDATMFYGIPFRQICDQNPALKVNTTTISKYNREVEVLPVYGKLGNYTLKADTFYIKANYGDSLNDNEGLQEIGTVGLDIFSHRVLIIDFPNGKFAITDSIAKVDKALLSGVDTVHIKVRYNKMFVSGLKLGNKTIDNIIYDSGSSIFSLVVTKEKWQELTGRTGEEKDNMILKIPAWQKEIEVIGAPTKEHLRLGQSEVKNPIIYYGLLEGLDLSKAPFKLEGLIGNVFFLDAILIIDFENEMMMIKK